MGAILVWKHRIQQRAMVGGLHVEGDVFAAAHVDDFVVDGERLPVAVGGLVIALAVELLDVEVLHVGVERGESPGHVLVVAGDDEGHAGERDPGGVEAGRAAGQPCTRCWAR